MRYLLLLFITVISFSINAQVSYPYYPISVVTSEDSFGVADSLNVTCQLSGTVHGGNFRGSSGYDFQIIAHENGQQEGIELFSFSSLNSYVVNEGDSLNVFGRISQFGGRTQLLLDSIALVKTSAQLATPLTITRIGENVESKLVRYDNLIVTNVASNQTNNHNIQVSDGNKVFVIRIDRDTPIRDSLLGNTFSIGDSICSITGFGSQFDSYPFTSGYQIFPYWFSDIDLSSCKTNCATPTAAFTKSSTTICGFDSLVLSDVSTGVTTNTNYFWDLDNDGIIDANGATISYVYEEAGNKTIGLKLTQGFCSDTVVDSITVLAPHHYRIDTVSINNGGSYTFPDGTTFSNINSNLIYRSSFPIANSCDSIIETRLFIVKIPPGPLTGTYTINSNALTLNRNFNSFADFTAFLTNRGVSGLVTVDVVQGSGPYNERLVFNSYNGASSSNRVLINGNGETLWFRPDSSDHRVVGFNAAEFITINNLRIESHHNFYGFGIHLMNGSDNNVIENCTIDMTRVNTYVSSGARSFGILSSGTKDSPFPQDSLPTASNLTIRNNNILGISSGSADNGIRLTGRRSQSSTGNLIESNTIVNANRFAITYYHQDGLIIRNNVLTRPNRMNISSTIGGISCFGGLNEGIIIEANEIKDFVVPAGNNVDIGAMFLNNFGNPPNPKTTFIQNNLIYNLSNPTTSGAYGVRGILVSDIDNAKVFHNTILLGPSTRSNGWTRGITQSNGGWYSSGFECKNNLIYMERNTNNPLGVNYNVAIDIDIVGPFSIEVDNNNVYYDTTRVNSFYGSVGNSRLLSLASFQNATDIFGNPLNLATNSLFLRSPFKSSTDLTPTNHALKAAGANVGVITDFYGNNRNVNQPDIGAISLDCFKPQNVTTTVLDTTVIIGWNDQNSANTWILEYDTIGFTPGMASQSIVINGSQQHTISGLQRGQRYDVYIRSLCTSQDTSDWSLKESFYINKPIEAGNYTINSTMPTANNNFNSFSDFSFRLNNDTLLGPITVNVVAGTGPYTEQFIVQTIRGNFATNAIVLKGNGETLQHSASASKLRIVGFEGVKHFTIDSLNIKQLSQHNGIGIHFDQYSDSNTVIHSIIDFNAIMDSTVNLNTAGIASTSSQTLLQNGASANYLHLSNNRILGSVQYGVILSGANSINSPNSFNNIITNNELNGFTQYGIYLTNQEDALIQGNKISSPSIQVATNTTGLHFEKGGSRNNTIVRNDIYNINNHSGNGNDTIVGISSENTAAINAENSFVNNFVRELSSDGQVVGIVNKNSSYNIYYHNSILLNDEKSVLGTGIGFYTKGQPTGIDLRNNIFTITQKGILGYGFYFENPFTLISNYNDVHVSCQANSYFGFDQMNYATLLDWQNGHLNGISQNSLESNPYLDGINNAFPTNISLKNAGTKLAVVEDYFLASRDTAPDLGAIEFTAASCQTPENITRGIKTSTTQELSWVERNGATLWQVEYDTAGFTIGSSQNRSIISTTPSIILPNLVTGKAYDFFVRSICSSSDTSLWSGCYQFVFDGLPLSGFYTIDSSRVTGNGNFQSFTDFELALQIQGINAAISVSVVPGSGPYNQSFTLGNIQGTSSTNTIYLNGNGERLEYSPSASDKRIVGFMGTKHFTIDSLNIVGLNPNWAYGVHFGSGSDSITISNSTIDLSLISNRLRNNSAGIAISNSESSLTAEANVNQLAIENNLILGGAAGGPYTGIYFNGILSNNRNNSIINNTITDFQSDGIFFINQEDLEVSRNKISRPNININTATYGIVIEGNSQNTLVERNAIFDLFNSNTVLTQPSYGILSFNNSPSVTKPNNIINNIIYNINTTSRIYGISNQSSNNTNYYHNTISINSFLNSGQNIYGFHQQGVAIGNDIQNNIISIKRDGNGLSFGLFLSTGFVTNCDYNNVHLNSTNQSLNFYGVYGISLQSLADWRTVNSNQFGQNSLNYNPMFFDRFTLKPLNSGLLNSGNGLGVLNDYEGILRDFVPEVGAFEYDSALAASIPFHPIVSINQEDGNGISDSLNLRCWTSGTVLGVNLSENLTGFEYLITESSSGVQEGIYTVSNSSQHIQLTEGDSLEILGTVIQRDGLTSFEVDSIRLVSTNGFLPSAQLQATLSDSIEGKLVQYDNLSVINSYNSATGLIEASNGSDTIAILVNTRTDVDDSLQVKNLNVGDTICSIIGVGYQIDGSFPYNENYSVLPMAFSFIDTITCQTVSINESIYNPSLINIYPNPTKGTIFIERKLNGGPIHLTLYNSVGQQVLKRIMSTENYALDINEAKGLYYLKVESNNEIEIVKLVKD